MILRAGTLRRDAYGRYRVRASLNAVERCVQRHPSAERVEMFHGNLLGTAADVARRIRHDGADGLVLEHGSGDRWLLDALVDRGVEMVGVPVRDHDPPPHEPLRTRALFAEGVVDPDAASRLGVRIAWHTTGGWLPRETELILADLAAVNRSGRRPAAMIGPVNHLLRTPGEFARVSPADRGIALAVEDLPPDAWSVLADQGVDQVDVVVTSAVRPSELRRLLCAASAHGVGVAVRAHLTSAEPARSDALRELITVDPRVRSTTGAPAADPGRALAAPPDARPVDLLVARRDQAAAGRRRIQRTLTGALVDADPFHGGCHEVWWRADVPWRPHLTWLRSVCDVSARVTVEDDDDVVTAHDLSGSAVSSVRHRMTPYAHLVDAIVRPGAVRALLESATDVAALVGDLVSARTGGDGGPLLRRSVRMPHLCLPGGAACPGRRLRRLVIDSSGVRLGPGGPVIGTVGDPLSSLLGSVRRIGGSLSGDCVCRPHDADGDARLREPWVPRVVATAGAVRDAGGSEAGWRASGLGGPLLHAGSSAPSWPVPVALLTGDRSSLLVHTRTGARLAVTPASAAIVEVACDHGARRPLDALDAVATAFGRGPAEVRDAVERVDSGLRAWLAAENRDIGERSAR
ncbi:MAG: hypothetical protein ACRCYX_10730 [Dermatophilaceae bacterium]